MAKNQKNVNEEIEEIEYEDVKRMPIAAFLGAGLAFGVAAGISIGNLLFGNYILSMALCIGVGLLGGLILGLVNHCKRKPE